MPNDLKNTKPIIGINNRYYIIHENGTDAEVLKNADKCIEDIVNKSAVFDDKEYPPIIISKNNIPFRSEQIAEYFLSKQMKKDFTMTKP